MGFFKVRRSLAVTGGSVNIGADCNLYRSAANVLTSDDALTLTGTLTPNGAVNAAGTVTTSGRLVIPHGTASPTVATDGQLFVYTKANVSRLGVRINGTPNYIAFPAATNGTVTVTVGGTP